MLRTLALTLLVSLFSLTLTCCSQNQATSQIDENDPFANLDLIPCQQGADCDSGQSCTSYGVCLNPCEADTDCAQNEGFSCNTQGLCVTPAISQAMETFDAQQESEDGFGEITNGEEIEMVAASITGQVVFAKNYPKQLRDVFYAYFNSGSKMFRGRLIALFYADQQATQPLSLVMAHVPGMDENGIYTYSTGFPKDFTIPSAPKGTSFMRLVLDSQFSVDNGKGGCSSIQDCPGDADALQTEAASVEINGGSGSQANNPKASVTALNSPTQNVGTLTMGSIHFSGKDLWKAPPADNGTIVVATSSAGNSYRNAIKIVHLSDYKIGSESYTLQSAQDNGNFPGDVCGFIQSHDSLYAVATYANYDGAAIFKMDPKTGLQLKDEPVAFIENENPGNAKTLPSPCRGVVGKDSSGNEHLYLIQFQGAGSLQTSEPYPFYHVNAASGDVSKPFSGQAYTMQAWRGIDIDSEGKNLFVSEMSWSKDSQTNKIHANRLIQIPLGADGSVNAGSIQVTKSNFASEDKCDSNLNWATGIRVIPSKSGEDMIVMGHDHGLAAFNADGTERFNLDLKKFGRLFSQVEFSPDRTKVYAMPQCKSDNANNDFTLPYGPDTEHADRNLIAILQPTQDGLEIASTQIDIDANGKADDGIDLDYFHLKKYIRSFQSTAPIPPVVYVGPQMAVGQNVIFVRGTGIQGGVSLGGQQVLSSSGMGQVQDLGVFGLADGRGIIFKNYMPFFDGLSSGAGKDSGQWGFDLGEPKEENSTGAILYIPGEPSPDADESGVPVKDCSQYKQTPPVDCTSSEDCWDYYPSGCEPIGVSFSCQQKKCTAAPLVPAAEEDRIIGENPGITIKGTSEPCKPGEKQIETILPGKHQCVPRDNEKPKTPKDKGITVEPSIDLSPQRFKTDADKLNRFQNGMGLPKKPN